MPRKRTRKRVERPTLPAMREVRTEARSRVAKTYFSSRYYRARAKRIVESFNRNPERFFNDWQKSLRNYILSVKGLRGKKALSRKEMNGLANSFFGEYCPNALTESIRNLRIENSGVYPSLFIGIYNTPHRAGERVSREAYKTYLEPVARMLFNSAGSESGFREAMQRVLEGRTNAHGKVRRLKGVGVKGSLSEGMQYGRYLSTVQQEYTGRFKGLTKKEANALRKRELLGRQLIVINEVHAAVAMYSAPKMERAIDNYIKENRMGIKKTTWPIWELATIGTRLHP